MYKIFADDTLIYDSTIEDYKIGKGTITLEINKSGSFTFSLYPDHFYYDRFVRLKTVITVYKSDKIVFRGRILNDVTDYWNNKVFTCEGELGFLQDSIIRPFEFTGSSKDLFTKFIVDHNAQVDEFKRFKIGTFDIDVSVDSNDYINRSNSAYESALSNLSSRLIESALGGYVYITHGEDGRDPTPTINYVSNFTKVSSQTIEFGSNLKDYTKTVKGEDIATAIIPLGAEVDDGDDETDNPKLTIASVNEGVDYVYSPRGVALYGWIFKTVEYENVTVAATLKSKAEADLDRVINQNTTIELNAIDLHLLDPSIESINIGEYVNARSTPHNFNEMLLCNKQTMDLLKPDNDSYVLGYSRQSFSNSSSRILSRVEKISIDYVTTEKFITKIRETKALIETTEDSILLNVSEQYVTTSEFNTEVGVLDSRIIQTADNIMLSVSSTYATRDSLDNYATNAELALKIGRDENDQIVSMLNASAEVINITSNRLTITSDKFTLDADGKVTTSDITINGGEINIDSSRGQVKIDSNGISMTLGNNSLELWANGLYAWENGIPAFLLSVESINSLNDPVGRLIGQWSIARSGVVSKVVTLLDLQNLGFIDESTRLANEVS